MNYPNPLESRQNNRSPLSQRIRLSSTALVVVLIFMICGISILYLIEFNKLSTAGIIIDDLQAKRDKLIIENETWNMRIADLKSLDVIKSQNIVRSMVDIGSNVEYVGTSEKTTE